MEIKFVYDESEITDLRQRPDADRIFRIITKDAATIISLADVQQKIDQMISSSQLSKRIIVYVMQF